MLKILQARLQQYMNHELPDVQAEFRKGRGTRDQMANIHWIIRKAREFQKNIYFCFIDYAKAFDCIQFCRSVMSGSLRSHGLHTPGLPVHHPLPEFTQNHVYRVRDVIQPSHPLSSPSPPTFILSQHQDIFQ